MPASSAVEVVVEATLHPLRGGPDALRPRALGSGVARGVVVPVELSDVEGHAGIILIGAQLPQAGQDHRAKPLLFVN